MDRIVLSASVINNGSTILSDAGVIPVYDPDYRMDLLIKLKNRQGDLTKAFFIFNAFPTSYKPGDDLNASQEAKLIEEIVFSYENFIELENDDLNSLQDEQLRALAKQAAAGLAAGLLG
jgi:hypothetical protein